MKNKYIYTLYPVQEEQNVYTKWQESENGKTFLKH